MLSQVLSVVTLAAFVLLPQDRFSQLFHYFKGPVNTVRGKRSQQINRLRERLGRGAVTKMQVCLTSEMACHGGNYTRLPLSLQS